MALLFTLALIQAPMVYATDTTLAPTATTLPNPAPAARDYFFGIALCEIASNCGRCVRERSVRLQVDGPSNTATAYFPTAMGESSEHKLRCKIDSPDTWRCDALGGKLKAKDGILQFTPAEKPVMISEKPHQACLVQKISAAH